MKIIIIIDRIINDLAVCEVDDRTLNIPLSSIIGKASEGDVLILTEPGAEPRYAIDHDATQRRRLSIKDKFNRLKL